MSTATRNENSQRTFLANVCTLEGHLSTPANLPILQVNPDRSVSPPAALAWVLRESSHYCVLERNLYINIKIVNES
jgi:hypothetical protein